MGDATKPGDSLQLPPALHGRYQPERLLGAGGFGRVVLSHDTKLDRRVAVKVLDAAFEGPDQVERFEREARVTSQLESEHIVRIFDSGVDPDTGQAWIAYEFLRGHDLSTIEDPVDDESMLLAWGREIAEALALAHDAGVVHRDVKPANVMLRDGTDPVLCDFGVARRDAGDTVHTEEGILLGTPSYMAPELFEGAPPTPATDQYAWAATLFELAYGEMLHPEEDPLDVYRKYQDGFRPRLEGPGRPELPTLAPALSRALDPDPARRFPGMRDFAAALLEPELSGIEPRPRTTRKQRERRRRRPRARPRRSWFVVPLLVLLGLVGWWSQDAGPPPGAGTGGPDEPELERAQEDLRRAMRRLDERFRWGKRGGDHLDEHLVDLVDATFPITFRRLTAAVLGHARALPPDSHPDLEVAAMNQMAMVVRAYKHLIRRADDLFWVRSNLTPGQTIHDFRESSRERFTEAMETAIRFIDDFHRIRPEPRGFALFQLAVMGAIAGSPHAFQDYRRMYRSVPRDGPLAAVIEPVKQLQSVIRLTGSHEAFTIEVLRECSRLALGLAERFAPPPARGETLDLWASSAPIVFHTALREKARIEDEDVARAVRCIDVLEASLDADPDPGDRDQIHATLEDFLNLKTRMLRKLDPRITRLVDERTHQLEVRARPKG